MAGYRPGRGGVLETMEDYARRRRREADLVGEQAAAATRETYRRALRSGADLNLPTAGDVMRYGADLLAGKRPQAAPNSSTVSPTGGARAGKPSVPATNTPSRRRGESWLDQSTTATGDMLETHVKVDPQYRGGRIPAEFGGGTWSGDALGWEKYDQLGQIWYGAPAPLKATAGGSVVAAGALVDQLDDERVPR